MLPSVSFSSDYPAFLFRPSIHFKTCSKQTRKALYEYNLQLH